MNSKGAFATAGAPLLFREQCSPMETQDISIRALRALPKESVVIVDVRKQPDDYEIPGSRRMPADRLVEMTVLPWDRSKIIVLYCGNGNSSRHIAARLRELGHDARALEGGFSAWRDHGNALDPISSKHEYY